jgi:hypothetical protein
VTPPRLLLILTENWAMRPPPDVGDLVAFAVEAEQAGTDGVMTRCGAAAAPRRHRPVHRVHRPGVFRKAEEQPVAGLSAATATPRDARPVAAQQAEDLWDMP